MLYMLLIYVPPDATPGESEPAAWMAFTQELRASGAMVAGDGFQGAETATTVRVRDGEAERTGGPSAATDEVLSGYYLIDVADLDAAVAWAAKVPGASYGSVEVRPMRVFR